MLEVDELQNVLEAVIMAAQKPMTEEALLAIFEESTRPTKGVLRQALSQLTDKHQGSAILLVEIASGYQFQVNPKYHPWVGRLWEEKPARYSRALFETLALIAYRQPISRGEIEDIRGVSLSPSIFKTLLEDREWIRVVGHRDVPGRPALYATTKQFLDYFGLKNLENLPSLPEIMNLEGVDENAEQALAASLQQQLPLQIDVNIPSVETETIDEEILDETLPTDGSDYLVVKENDNLDEDLTENETFLEEEILEEDELESESETENEMESEAELSEEAYV